MHRREFLISTSALALAPTPLLGAQRVEGLGCVPPVPLKWRLSIPTTGGASLQRFMVEYEALKDRAAAAGRREAACRDRIPYEDAVADPYAVDPHTVNVPLKPMDHPPATDSHDPFEFWRMRRDNMRKQNLG